MARTKQRARRASNASDSSDEGGGFRGKFKRVTDKLPSSSTISETLWKWRCKIFPPKEGDSDDESEEDKKKEVGKDPVVKTMYEGPESTHWNYDWVDYPPKQISKAAAKSQDRVAIKVFKVKDMEKPCIAGRSPLKFHSIEVQNPALLAALAPILKQQDYHISENESAKFTPPFAPLWFCKGEIQALHKKTPDGDSLKEHLTLLTNVMTDIHKELTIKKKNLEPSGLIDFKTAWTLYPRGTTVYSRDLASEFLCKVTSAEYVTHTSGTYLDIHAKVLKFNGQSFIWSSKSLKIPGFKGNKPIRQLSHYPVDFSSDKPAIYSRLLARGKSVLDLQGLKYHCYNSVALYMDGEEIHKQNVEGRILVDTTGYHKYKENDVRRGDKKKSKRREDEEGEDDDWALGGWDDDSDSESESEDEYDSDSDSDNDDDDNPVARSRALRKPLSERQCQRNKREMLKREEDLVFIYGLIGGYSLKSKLWLQFYVEDIEPMVWNDAAYSHLVYDEQQKDLILSFVQNHSANGPSPTNSASSSSSTAVEDEATADATAPTRTLAPMEDVIVGKGQGLVVLLSGPPGTGKTLMAEAVADRTHRPLMYLQAEDLGISASDLGPRLKRSLQMAAEWDAVVLLDEADVYMAERDPNNIHRNELVSIFLRELEYFRGILFLTTNLYRTIDQAFRSRVSLHLIFNSLSRDARELVWRKFLERLPEDGAAVGKQVEKESVSDADLKEISLWQLNGREIKNAVKMVRSWCHHKGYVLGLDKLESGIKVTNPHATKDSDVDPELYD